jgi:hypothetical protein
MERARRSARVDGLAAGLRVALGGARPVPCSAGGRAVVPAGVAGQVRAWRFPDRVVLDTAVSVRLLRHELADAEGLRLVQVTDTGGDRADAATPLADAATPPADADAAALAGVRVGLAERMLARAVDRLRGRVTGGSPLIQRQLVASTVAEAAIALELAAAGGGPDAGLPDLHRRLSEVEWSIAGLFGAAGYLRDDPARCLYLVRLVADCWVRPAVPGRWG